MKLLTFLILLCSSTLCLGQLEHPKASPLSKIEQDFGLSKVSIVYSRPAARERTIFGKDVNGLPGLVPYNRIWRVGANESTKVTFNTMVLVKGKTLRPGTYALYAFPNKDVWEIVFHSNTSHWGDGRKQYNPDEDALRISVNPKNGISFQENFQISFDRITHNSIDVILSWAHTKIAIPIAVDTEKAMENQINNKLNTNPTAQTYYEIARYYQEQGIKSKLALEYVVKALDLGGDTYYFFRVKSLLQADLGRYKDAISSANKSLSIAQKLEKDEFVRMNKRNILSWQKLLQSQNH